MNSRVMRRKPTKRSYAGSSGSMWTGPYTITDLKHNMVIIIGEKNENYVKSQGLLIKLFAGNTLGSRNRAGAKGEGSIKPTEAIL